MKTLKDKQIYIKDYDPKTWVTINNILYKEENLKQAIKDLKDKIGYAKNQKGYFYFDDDNKEVYNQFMSIIDKIMGVWEK